MLFKKVMPLLIVYKSIIFHTRCDLALIILLNLWHSDKWKMLSCHFNLLVLIICEVNYVFVGLFFFPMSLFRSFSHYSLNYSSFPICKISLYLKEFWPLSLKYFAHFSQNYPFYLWHCLLYFCYVISIFENEKILNKYWFSYPCLKFSL